MMRKGWRWSTPPPRRIAKQYHDMLYERLQRKGFLSRDVQRMVNQDRNVFAACMVAASRTPGSC